MCSYKFIHKTKTSFHHIGQNWENILNCLANILLKTFKLYDSRQTKVNFTENSTFLFPIITPEIKEILFKI